MQIGYTVFYFKFIIRHVLYNERKGKQAHIHHPPPPPLFVNATHYEWQNMNLIQK